MSSSSLLRFLVTATFYAVEMYEANRRTTWMLRWVDSKWGWWHDEMKGGGVEIREKEKKKRSPTYVTVYVFIPIHWPYIYIYILVFDRRVFPNGRLLETHCYIYTYGYISYTLHCHYIRCNVYAIYIYSQQDYSSNFFFRFPRFI